MKTKLAQLSILVLLLVGFASLYLYQYKKSASKDIGMVGFYWGAFDPPTEAHFAIMKAALKNLPLKKLLVIVNNQAYKNYDYPLESRKEMIQQNLSSDEMQKIEILWQDDRHKLDYPALRKLFPEGALCAISGFDAYKKWLDYSTPSERAQYDTIAVIPRGEEPPILVDENAVLLPIDDKYKHVSSTRVKSAASLMQSDTPAMIYN